MPDEEPADPHEELDPDGEPAEGEHGSGEEPSDLERAVGVVEAVAAVAETTKKVIEAAQHGHGEIAAGQAIDGGTGAAGSLVEATVGETKEAHALAEEAEAVLEIVSAGAEALVAVAETARALAGSEHDSGAAHASGGGAHDDVHGAHGAHGTSAADDSEIVFEIETSADPDHLLRVGSVELEEKLGDTYVARVEVASEIRWSELPMVAASDLLGADVTISILRGGAARKIHGVVRRVEEESTSSTQLVMRLEVVPAMALLAQQIDSRVFWELSVLDVIDAVLGAGLAPYDREVGFSMIERDPREYCVQYQESDLDFVHRLLEEEGLTYFFDHEGDREKVVIVETNEQLPGLRGDHMDWLRITDGVHGQAEHDAITEMHEARRVVPTGLALCDHDWRQSRTRPISVCPDDPQDDRGRSRLVYDHARVLELGAQPGGHDGARQVRLRKELITRDAIVAGGRSTAMRLSAGLAFTTHDDRELAPLENRSWVVTSVRHRGSDPRLQAIRGGDGTGEARYENRFECIPVDVPYRPSRRTAKPRIFGMQTGVVVGPQGQPIFSDEHRRVRVRFHWDRYRPNDTGQTQDLDRHTCWVRVSQSWAGSGYGTTFLPRVGMEVVVSFLDGDPDRPIVVGCVYNGENPPPYTSEAEWTVSTLKTQSVDGELVGPGFNELRFEDKKGSEQVFVHAERDLDEVVEHDHSTRVKRNQSNTVDVDQTEHIGRDQELRVDRDRLKRVERNERNVVVGCRFSKVKMDDTTAVHWDQRLDVGKQRIITVGERETEIFNGGRVCEVKLEDSLKVTGGANRNVEVTGQYNLKADEHLHLEQAAQMVHLGDSRVHVESDGTITLTRPGSTVFLAADGIQLSTEGSLILRGGGCELTMHEGRVLITAVDEAKMRAGDGVVKVAPQYAQIAGPNVSVDAQQIAAVQAGTLVRIN